jgi:hypothetical protein
MFAPLSILLTLATGPGTGRTPPRFEINPSAGGFVTSASVSISLKSLPNGETAAVIDMENLRVTKADRNAAAKPHSNFNLRFPSEGPGRGLKGPGAGSRQAQRQAADSSGGRVRADSTRRARPDSTRRIRSDSAKRVRPDSAKRVLTDSTE